MPKPPPRPKPAPQRGWLRIRQAWSWRHLDLFLVALATIVVAGVNYWWATTETRPPDWDTARHLWTSLLYLQTLHAHQVLPFLQQYHYYPPLVYWTALPFYKLFGITLPAAVLSNAVFVAVLLYAVYFLGRKIGGRSTGLLAVILTAGYPMVVSQFKEFQLDAPLAAMVALALCLLVYSEGFRRRRLTLAFGAVCGLGMLTKWTFIACLLLPTLWALGQAIIADVRARAPRRLAIVGVAALIAYTICSPWYVANIQQFRVDMKANGAPQAVLEGDPQVGTWAGNLYYLNNFVNEQVFLLPALLFLLSLGVILWRRPRRPGLPETLLLIGGIYLTFTFLANKDARYTLPMLPAIAVISAYGLSCLRGRWRIAASALVALYSIFMVSVISFGAPAFPAAVNLPLGAGSLTVFAQRGYIIGPPTHEDWGLPTVMTYLSRQPAGQRSLSYSGPDTIWFNSWDLTYYGQLDGIALTGQAAYQLERTIGPPTHSPALLRRQLPDGTTLSLYHR